MQAQKSIVDTVKELENVSLKEYSTMKLGGTARYVAEVTNETELKEAVSWADEKSLPSIMIGAGSNIIWADEGYDGLLIVSKIKQFEVLQRDDENYFITVGSGEEWDAVVERSVKEGLSGIEALSLIPGTAGATPVQNVGAYGQEIADVFVSAQVYDRQTKAITFLSKYDMEFKYRSSMLKEKEHGRYFIIAITLHLMKKNPKPPFYQSLDRLLAEQGVTEYTPKIIRDAVIKIRSSKLPDPKKVANCGSFFANPIVDEGTLVQIQSVHPDVVFWRLEAGRGVKLSAAWLIEKVGFKEIENDPTGMTVWSKQSLVLVNKSAQSTAQLIEFRDRIIGAVKKEFEVTLRQEPEFLPLASQLASNTPSRIEDDLDLSTLS